MEKRLTPEQAGEIYSVYDRFVYYCTKLNRRLPDYVERQEASQVILQKYFSQPRVPQFPLAKKWQQEPEGTFLVLKYPKFFVKVMDAIIAPLVTAKPAKRARVAVKKKPVFVSNKKFNNGR